MLYLIIKVIHNNGLKFENTEYTEENKNHWKLSHLEITSATMLVYLLIDFFLTYKYIFLLQNNLRNIHWLIFWNKSNNRPWILSHVIVFTWHTYNGCIIFKYTACIAGDKGLIPGLGRSLREGTSNPFQYSCLGNPMDRGVWKATVYVVARVRYDLAIKKQ